MKIGLVAPPFIAVPPEDYGGTELFVAHLAEGLQREGIDVVVYTNGESKVNAQRRWIYERSEWPLKASQHVFERELNHTAWAVQDAARDCDVVHVQSAMAIALSRFVNRPMVLTLHGPNDKKLTEYYRSYPNLHYVCISEAQSQNESMPKMRIIHHGIDLSSYQLVENKQQYLSFIGRIAPIKGTHLAIDVARRTGIPLKIAGEIQPVNREYFEKKIKPELDGKLVEYIGPADLRAKNELLGNSMAMLFPILWNEPFGLVMVEAMACGTPVLAMPGGSVAEIVRNGVSGFICSSAREMSKRVRDLNIPAASVRRYVEENFSVERMVRSYASLYEQILREGQAAEVAVDPNFSRSKAS
ncbi:MAG: glycosyltransferase family 4 protein [Acidobacteria bacterium]|nr:glycosyltransferase family 4 protein [Acidobacteriota bacterium]